MIDRIYPKGSVIPRGPYSPAVRAGDFIYVSGQGPVDPVTDQLVYGDIQNETERVLNNIRIILEGAGATMNDVVKCNVYLSDGRDFAAMNGIYATFFGENKPARTTIECKFANPLMKVEIDCVAWRPKS